MKKFVFDKFRQSNKREMAFSLLDLLLVVAVVSLLAFALIGTPYKVHAETLAWQSSTNLTIQTSTGVVATLVAPEASPVQKRSTLIVYNPNAYAVHVKLGSLFATNDADYLVIPASNNVPIFTGGTEYQGPVTARSSVTNAAPTLRLFQGGF